MVRVAEYGGDSRVGTSGEKTCEAEGYLVCVVSQCQRADARRRTLPCPPTIATLNALAAIINNNLLCADGGTDKTEVVAHVVVLGVQ